jgi:F-type H+-transporting ATPase subunit delta
MKNSKVAKRYAKSLLDLSLENNSLDKTFEDMQTVLRAIGESRDLELMLLSPVLQPSQKVKALEAVFTDHVEELSMKFIRLICSHGREKMMKGIVAEFIAQVKVHKNIIEAYVTTATPLDDSSREKVKSIVKESHNGTVELHEAVDASLVGGFILKVGDQRIDASVASKLRKLKREFVGTHAN